ncbi:hypothetical protein BDZ89DRAFT_1164038 [Hymenopellis radicata]|nr:hypothetical protein BDZ89DRAFT_1164038 [Hymenopellis radicata]
MKHFWNQFLRLIRKSTCVDSFTPEFQPSPHIALLIASNEAPSDAQEAKLRRLRLDGRNRLERLDALIKETQQTLADLQARRGALASQMVQHDIVLHPIRRVPPDVLCEIFSLATSIGVTPYQITAICRSWRQIATSFHLLWRKLAVPYLPDPRLCRNQEGINYWDFECAKRLAPSLETYIRNSDTSRLSLDIYIDSLFPCTHPLYPLLIQSAKRVEQLRLHVCDPRLLEGSAIQNLIQGSTDLEKLSLGFDPPYSMMPPAAISLPKTLRSLVIVPYAWLARHSIDLAWDGIQHLVLQSRHLGEAETSSRSVKDVLSRTSHLLSLTLSNSWDGTGRAEYNQPFTRLARGIHSVTLYTKTPFQLSRLQELVVEHENANILHVLDDVILPL